MLLLLLLWDLLQRLLRLVLNNWLLKGRLLICWLPSLRLLWNYMLCLLLLLKLRLLLRLVLHHQVIVVRCMNSCCCRNCRRMRLLLLLTHSSSLQCLLCLGEFLFERRNLLSQSVHFLVGGILKSYKLLWIGLDVSYFIVKGRFNGNDFLLCRFKVITGHDVTPVGVIESLTSFSIYVHGIVGEGCGQISWNGILAMCWSVLGPVQKLADLGG